MQVNVPLPIKYLGVDYAAGNQTITDSIALELILLGLAARVTPLPVPVLVGGTISPLSGAGVKTIWEGSQADYDAIGTKDSNTLYVII